MLTVLDGRDRRRFASVAPSMRRRLVSDTKRAQSRGVQTLSRQHVWCLTPGDPVGDLLARRSKQINDRSMVTRAENGV